MPPILPDGGDVPGPLLVPHRRKDKDRRMVHPLDPTAAGFLMA